MPATTARNRRAERHLWRQIRHIFRNMDPATVKRREAIRETVFVLSITALWMLPVTIIWHVLSQLIVHGF